MKRLFKTVVATTATIAMVASMGASAFTTEEMAKAELQNMEFAGFDTTKADEGSFNRIYNEKIDGKFTNKQILEPMGILDIEWKHDGYEVAYPHAGYDRLYLSEPEYMGGAWKVQDIYRYNNLYPQWDIRRSDYEWEVVRPHYVWERRQTKINNETWTWDFGMEFPEGNAKFQVPDSELKTKTSKKALNVEYTYENYGFGKYNNDGLLDDAGYVDDGTELDCHEKEMYSKFINNVKGESEAVQKLNKRPIAELAIDAWETLLPGQSDVEIAWDAVETYNKYKKLEPFKTKESIEAEEAWIKADKTGLLSWDALSKRTSNGVYTQYVVTDEMIQAMVPVVKSEFITAQLNATTPADTKNVAELYHLSRRMGYDWDWDYNDSFKVRYDAEIGWTKPEFQKTEPYHQYQFLIIDGIVCDGSFVNIHVEDAEEWRYVTVQKPYIGRYTDGIATPNVEWKFYCYEELNVVNDGGEPSTVFPVVEQKFIDGEPVIIDGEFVLRKPVGRFGTKYIVDLGDRLELRICEGAKGVNDVLYVPSVDPISKSTTDGIYKYDGNVGGYVNNFGGSAADVEAEIAADEHPQTLVDKLRANSNEHEIWEVSADLVAQYEELEAMLAGRKNEEQRDKAALALAETDGYKAYLALDPEDERVKMGAEAFIKEYVLAYFDAYVAAYCESHVDAFAEYLEYYHDTDLEIKMDYEDFYADWVVNNWDKFVNKYDFSKAYLILHD